MSAPHRDRGQAVVELALVLPLVCALLMGVVQVGLVVRSQLAVQVAARAAARAAAISADASAAAADGAYGAVRLRPLVVEVELTTLRAGSGSTGSNSGTSSVDANDPAGRSAARRDDSGNGSNSDSDDAALGTSPARIAVVAATVRYVDPTDVPLIGLFIPAIELRATVTMAVEPP